MHADAKIGDLVVEVAEGDIAEQEGFAAVVNAANAELLPGAGVAGAIHRRAGPGLARECRQLAPISTGHCVLSTGHDLPNPWVIHCLGPVYRDEDDPAALLASCYREALSIAEEKGIESIAFPAISTGVFGYPLEESAEIALGAVAAAAASLRSVRRVRFVLFGTAAYRAYAAALAAIGR